jgi:hypothetical protein
MSDNVPVPRKRVRRHRDRAVTQESCDRWNREHPIGSPVWVLRDHGERVASRTRSEAYLVAYGEPVVLLEGISGCYALYRVTYRDEVSDASEL